MKLTNIATISMMTLLLVACGGGGSGGGNSASTNATPPPEGEKVVAPIADPSVEPIVEPLDIPVPEPTEPVVVEAERVPDVNAVYASTAELVVARQFILNHEYELAVSYKNESNRSAYLSICSEFTEDDESIKVNYNSCLLRTSIEGDYASTLSVGNDKNRLVMALWYFDDLNNPKYEIWENDNNGDSSKVFEVN